MSKKIEPTLIEGGHFTDVRGTLTFNNTFDVAPVRRIYFVENASSEIIRAWQGHKIEQRWFTVVSGSFIIKVIKIDNWEQPTKQNEEFLFSLNAKDFSVLHVPSGYATSIQAAELHSKLMAMGDYLLGSTRDEYRFPADYFNLLKDSD
jgi:dTDP-4-dehydrorhamnose 3,5-epimerase-like enzyme